MSGQIQDVGKTVCNIEGRKLQGVNITQYKTILYTLVIDLGREDNFDC